MNLDINLLDVLHMICMSIVHNIFLISHLPQHFYSLFILPLFLLLLFFLLSLSPFFFLSLFLYLFSFISINSNYLFLFFSLILFLVFHFLFTCVYLLMFIIWIYIFLPLIYPCIPSQYFLKNSMLDFHHKFLNVLASNKT